MLEKNFLEALSDNINIDKSKCVFCGVCVDTCILDNLRLKLAPCRGACPLGVNVQGYVQEIARGHEQEALEILRKTLIFPEILGRVCPAPCEAACHRGQVADAPVASRMLKRYLTKGQKAGDIPVPEIAPETGKHVAVIGSGPAGLQAAHDLRLAGHEVTVIESEKKPGGMLRWAIPQFRLPLEVVERELTLLEKMGVDFQCQVKVGEDVSLEKLKADHDAVVMATGCPLPLPLDVEGKDLEGVFSGLDLLRSLRAGDNPTFSGSVVVIGGGNVAVDAARAALRLGAEKVTMVSLEAEADLPAFDEEVALARKEGIKFEPSCGPVRFEEENGRVAGVELQRCLAVFNAQGKFEPQFDSCELRVLHADAVIVAIGQGRDKDLFQKVDAVDPLTLQAGDSNLFLAGDCAGGLGSVVRAMKSGKEAAESINRLLAGEHLAYGRSYEGPIVTEFDIDTSVGSKEPRVTPPMNVFGGKGDFNESEKDLSQEQARAEAGRCFSCGAPFGKFRTCWFCLPCEVECPQEALWVDIPYLLR